MFTRPSKAWSEPLGNFKTVPRTKTMPQRKQGSLRQHKSRPFKMETAVNLKRKSERFFWFLARREK